MERYREEIVFIPQNKNMISHISRSEDSVYVLHGLVPGYRQMSPASGDPMVRAASGGDICPRCPLCLDPATAAGS